ncbi:MAG: TM0106 family RecB-like putative nuclease [Anaerolineae bacterium]|nr:TM0106 family RecB-like putative nuclease [Anaerolineae bacterium]
MPVTLTATDLSNLLACDRKVYLEYNGPETERVLASDFDAWLIQQGREFELRVLTGMDYVRPDYPAGRLEAGFSATHALMRHGAPAIYQGVLLAEQLAGIPDLLIRVEGPSALGIHHYRPVDIKFGSEAKERYRLQVMAYVWLLERLQGVRPEGRLILRPPRADATTGSRYHEEPVPFEEAFFNDALNRARRLAGGEEPRPFLASVCQSCAWKRLCDEEATATQDASLVTGLKRTVWTELHGQGLGTLPALAGANAAHLQQIRGVGDRTARSIIRQAQALVEQKAILIGDHGLPAPGRAAAYFDVESIPTEGLIYLFGLLVQEGGRQRYFAEICERPEEEGAVWEHFLRRASRVDGPVFHYSSYERTAIGQMTTRYGSDPRAEALLNRMIDLEKALKACAVLPLRSYSLKDVAPWMGFTWRTGISGGGDSIVEYSRYQQDGNPERMEAITRYNEDDCQATAAVHRWLLAQDGGGP